MRRRIIMGENNKGDNHEYVDFGIALSTVKWAKCNVGAELETDSGNYYRYGKGTEEYVYPNQTDYTGIENPLALSADTAAQVWHNGWRMPTSADCIELSASTTYEYDYKDGMYGGKFISPYDSTKYIFIPSAGCYHNGGRKYWNQGAYVWTSTPKNSEQSYILNAIAGNTSISGDYIYRGFPVRPVKDFPFNSNVLFYNSMTSNKEIFNTDSLPSGNGYIPIAIEVVPRSHNRYGDNSGGFIALTCINSNGVKQTPTKSNVFDSLKMKWGPMPGGAPVTDFPTIDGSNTNGYVQTQISGDEIGVKYFSVPNIVYPYTDTSSYAIKEYTVGCLSDFNGVSNTNALNSSTYPAAYACKKYKTTGTTAGDWYLPAAGELAYVPSVWYQLCYTIAHLNKKYGNIGTLINGSPYWTSTECDYAYAWSINRGNGNIKQDYCDANLIVRPFIRYKDGD